jgi:hypothetical protein
MCLPLREPSFFTKAFDRKRSMNFRFYLMMAVLLLIGLEAIYSLYHLATFAL